ncbi:MAG: ABC transporter substrate-binding protein [Alphaproteobacteria bacterium]|nr:ABC transporter substrate-binding protein [Alphaproteobacteria bacterium]
MSKSMKRSSQNYLIFGLVASLITLISSTKFSHSAESHTLKIGFLATLSGPGGALGQDQYDGFMLAVEQGGGKLSNHPITVIKADDQQKPDIGVQMAQKLLESDKVSLITGVTFSNVMMAVAKPITESNRILLGSNAGPSPLAGKACHKLFFSTSWNNDSLHETMGQFANDAGYKRVYLLAPNYQGGKDALTGFKRFFKGQIVDEQLTEVNQPDYSAQIADLQAAKPDAVFVFYPGGMGVNFVKQYQQAGLFGTIPMLSASTIDGINLPALQNTALGAVTGSPYSPDLPNPENKKFVTEFTKKYGRVPSMYAAQSYDAARLLEAALAKMVMDKSVDYTENLRKAIKDVGSKTNGFRSVSGEFQLNRNNFPIRNFYRVDVVKDASGRAALVTKATVLTRHKDAYYSECGL